MTSHSQGDIYLKVNEAWKKSLGHNNFGDDDDFFSVGGDSLRAHRLIRDLSDAGLDVDLSQFIENTTVATLTATLADGGDGTSRPRIRPLPR